MKNHFFFPGKCLAVITVVIFITSCNKTFDTPPDNADPDVNVTMSIMELKARYTAIGDFQRIQDDQIISGIVVADDRSGNFYQQVVIQDETGGIPVLLDVSNAYTQYPVGRRIFVKLKGLMLGDYGGTIQVGMDSSRSDNGRYLNLDGIPEALFDQYIIKGSFNNTVTPKVVTPADFTKAINNPLISTLVQMENMEFADADTGKTYADPAKTTSAVNFTISNCSGQNMVLRNSSYARFAGLSVPDGNGTITGIANIYNSTTQIFIRDTADLQFTASRCAVQPPVLINIATLRALYTADRNLDKNYIVGGTVISDIDNKNYTTGTFVMQSGDRAIIVYKYKGTPAYVLGDSVVLNLSSKDSLINFRNALELKLNEDFAYPSAVVSGKTVTPVEKTIAEVNASLSLPPGDPGNFEYTLVKIKNATAASGTFSGNKTLTDTSGSIVLYTSASATFATAALPVNDPDWVLYAYNYGSVKEASVRNLNDITGGIFTEPSTGGGIDLGDTSPYLQDFNTIGSGLPTGINVMTNAKTDTVGRMASLTTAATVWSNISGAFKNFASATGLSSAATAGEQSASTDRALGLRQTGSFGEFTSGTTGGGGAFVFTINNTTGKSNLSLDFILQSLDASASGRTVTWTVDYGIGENPANFTVITTTPTPLTTALGTFASTAIHADLPAALNNNASKIWIRIVTLSASTGSGSRPSTAIDNFKISW
ncbi:MAG: DUF5689 domain-containing protein [Niabella sp.]